MASGVPPEACSYYPSDHAGAGEIVRRCGRSMFFGDVGAIGTVAGDPRVELHGPGYTKVLIGADVADHATDSLDVIVTSVAANGGRSCVNASGVWMPTGGAALAGALAERLAAIRPLPADHPEAAIAPFVDPAVARRISLQIDAGLAEPGAEEVTARFRKGSRLVEVNGCTYLLPTVVHCTSSSHALANREFLFPFVSVVDVTAEEMAAMPGPMGPTLACMVLTEDPALIDRVLASDAISRLNLGPIPTNEIRWDQPHEGNLFEHLYVRRSCQRAG
jgi:acyl-CoA reductase-like NAD-dependent aldehyde dehydrogenase